MNLEELFNEDSAQPFDMREQNNLPDFLDKKYSKLVGTFDGYDIYGSRFYGEKYDAYGILNNQQNVCATLVIQTQEKMYDGKKCQQIEKVWVDKNDRGKALATSLLAFVIRKLKTNLISNRLITNDGEIFYKKLIQKKTFDFEFFDFVKSKRLNDLPNDLFSKPNSYQIILTQHFLEGFEDRLFGHGEKHILNELWCFRHPYNQSEWD